MTPSREQFGLRVMSGEARGPGAGALRALLALVEPVYAGVMRLRNSLYDRGVFRAHRLPVPVVSVGNVTAGGTGKTPMVRWLAGRMVELGIKPAILLRGYKRAGGISDEEQLLRGYLGPSAIVMADADRVAGGRRVLQAHPDVGLVILDDGFQHRRLARDFDLVLVDAANPFGYGHVHPRGLMREPLAGLGRADAFVITRVDQATPDQLAKLEALLRSHSHIAPIYRARHALVGFRTSADVDLPLAALADHRYYAFAGIANPASLERQLLTLPGEKRGHHWFPDHHDYTPADLASLASAAREAGADILLATEKDWTKLVGLAGAMSPNLPIWRLQMRIEFEGAGEQGLLDLIGARLDQSALPAVSPGA